MLEVLKKKGALKGKDVKRVVFNAITKQSVLEAMQHPRDVDADLVDAYLARRALDYLVGFSLSPVLWRKLPGRARRARAIGGAAPHLRPRTRDRGLPRPGILDDRRDLHHPQGGEFQASLNAIDGKKLGKLDLGDEASARAIEQAVKGQPFKVDSLESKPAKRHPYPPFRTSTLQQEASRKLGFSSSRTMQLASASTRASTSAAKPWASSPTCEPMAWTWRRRPWPRPAMPFSRPLANPTCPRYHATTPARPRTRRKPMRPSGPTEVSRHPASLRKALDPDQLALYDLIWKRTVASQMESAALERTTADIGTTGRDGKHYSFRATARW